MTSKRLHRTAASAFAAVALAAAGAGIAAVGSGAIAFGGSGGAAIVTHAPGTRTLTLAANEVTKAATDPTYDQQVCTDPWIPSLTSCATYVKSCAKKHQSNPVQVVVVFTETGRLVSC